MCKEFQKTYYYLNRRLTVCNTEQLLSGQLVWNKFVKCAAHEWNHMAVFVKQYKNTDTVKIL